MSRMPVDLRGPRRAGAARRRRVDGRARRVGERDAEAAEHPDGVGALGAAADDAGRHPDGPARLRLLRLSGALLPDAVPGARCARARRARARAPARGGHRRRRRSGARARPRRLRAAGRDVPRRRRARAPDLDAGARPGGALRARPRPRAAARRGRAGVRERVPHAQHGLRVPARDPGVGARVRRLGGGRAVALRRRRAEGLPAPRSGRPDGAADLGALRAGPRRRRRRGRRAAARFLPDHRLLDGGGVHEALGAVRRERRAARARPVTETLRLAARLRRSLRAGSSGAEAGAEAEAGRATAEGPRGPA